MPDTQTSPAIPPVTRREDYKPPEWLVPDVALDFDLGVERTIVRARLDVTRNGEHSVPLKLNASGLNILDVRLDGAPVNYWFENDVLRIPVTAPRRRVSLSADAFIGTTSVSCDR